MAAISSDDDSNDECVLSLFTYLQATELQMVTASYHYIFMDLVRKQLRFILKGYFTQCRGVM